MTFEEYFYIGYVCVYTYFREIAIAICNRNILSPIRYANEY